MLDASVKFALTTQLKKSLRTTLLMAAPPASVPIADAQRAPDARVADLMRAGRVRVALFPSFMYSKDPVSGELRGVGIEIARALGARLGVEVLLVEYRCRKTEVAPYHSQTGDQGELSEDYEAAGGSDHAACSPFAHFSHITAGHRLNMKRPAHATAKHG